MTSQLQKVNIKLVKWETCSHKVPILTRNMLCAGSPQGGKDACQVMELVPCLEKGRYRGLANIFRIIGSPLPLLDEFPKATITNYHKQGGFKQ